MTETKDENQCQIHIFEEKLNNWLRSHKKHIKSDVIDALVAFSQQCIETTSQHTEQNRQRFETALNMCQEHKDAYEHKLIELNTSIKNVAKQNEHFGNKISLLSGQFLTENCNNIALATKETLTKLDLIEEIVEQTRLEKNQLTDTTVDLQTFVSDSLREFQTAMSHLFQSVNNFQHTIGTKFLNINNKLNDLDRVQQSNSTQIGVIKETLLGHETNLKKCASSLFESKISQPIKENLDLSAQHMAQIAADQKALGETFKSFANENQKVKFDHFFFDWVLHLDYEIIIILAC